MHINIVSFSHKYADYITNTVTDRKKSLVITNDHGLGNFNSCNLDHLFDIKSNDVVIRISVFPIKDIKNVGLYHIINDSIKPEAIILEASYRNDYTHYGDALVFLVDSVMDSVEVFSAGYGIDVKVGNNLFEFINKTISKRVNNALVNNTLNDASANSSSFALDKKVIDKINACEDEIKELRNDVHECLDTFKGLTKSM